MKELVKMILRTTVVCALTALHAPMRARVLPLTAPLLTAYSASLASSDVFVTETEMM